MNCNCSNMKCAFYGCQSAAKLNRPCAGTITVGANWPITQQANYGWVCPKCNKVNAPFMPECNCHKNTITSNGTNDIGGAK